GANLQPLGRAETDRLSFFTDRAGHTRSSEGTPTDSREPVEKDRASSVARGPLKDKTLAHHGVVAPLHGHGVGGPRRKARAWELRQAGRSVGHAQAHGPALNVKQEVDPFVGSVRVVDAPSAQIPARVGRPAEGVPVYLRIDHRSLRSGDA